MKAVIFGGNGFIGSHLVDRLLDSGWDICVFDKNKEKFRGEKKGIRYIYGDFGDRQLMRTALMNMDIVFHLIGTTLPSTSNENPIFDVQSNVLNSIVLLEECINESPKKIIFLSSGGTVYGIPQKNPVSELHATNPICSYGITKLAIEKYLHLFHHLYGLNYTILRAGNPFGERQDPYGQQGIISVFLGKIQRKEPIVIWGDGTIVRDYFYIDNLVDAFLASIDSPNSNGVFNIGSGRGYSLLQILDELKKITGKSPEVIYEKSRKFDIPELVLNTTKAKNELGWRIKVSIEEGIEKVWKWIQHDCPD